MSLREMVPLRERQRRLRNFFCYKRELEMVMLCLSLCSVVVYRVASARKTVSEGGYEM